MRMSDFLEQDELKGKLRTATWAQRANTTAYALGDRVYLASFDGNVYECVAAGMSAGSPPAFNTNIGDTTTDGTVTWLTLKLGSPKRPLYVGLYTVAPTDAGGGTAVAGGSYARVAHQPSDSNWSAPTQEGNAMNSAAITFPAPTADWGEVVAFGVFDRLTAGNLLWWGLLTDPLTVKNGDPAPSFAAGSLQFLDKQRRNPGLRTTLP